MCRMPRECGNVLKERPVGGMKVPFRLGTPLGDFSLAERGGAKYTLCPSAGRILVRRVSGISRRTSLFLELEGGTPCIAKLISS